MAKHTTSVEVQTAKYAGIDYHRRMMMVSIGDAQGKLLLQEKLFTNDTEKIRQFFLQFPGLVCAVESCRGMEWFVDLLQELGLEVRLCNPVRMKIICDTAFKNDKIDSKKILDLLARDYLPTCYLASPQERHLRERIRWRARLVSKASSIKTAIQAILAKENIHSLKNPFTVVGRASWADLPISEVHKELLTDMFAALAMLEKAVTQQTAWIEGYGAQDKGIDLLKTIPGIAEITAFAYRAEIGDVHRFKSPAQVSAYIGYVPKLDESANRRRLGPITKQGSSLLRVMLIQSAWHAIRTNSELARRFSLISRRRGKKVAIVAIARLLAEIAFCVLRDQVPFDENRLTTKPSVTTR